MFKGVLWALWVFLSVGWAKSSPTSYEYMMKDGWIAFDNKEYKKALRIYHKLNQAGSAMGAEFLADRYLAGDGGIKRNYAKAKFYYQKAILNFIGPIPQGYTVGDGSYEYEAAIRAGFKLAGMYAKGLGTPKNPKKAFDLYQRVLVYKADNACYPISKDWRFGHKRCLKLLGSYSSYDYGWNRFEDIPQLSDALYYVGKAYKKGKIVPKNPKKAQQFLASAVDLQNQDALKDMDRLLELAKQAKKRQDYKRAARLYSQASNLHSIMGTFLLADLYFEGKGVKQDFNQAGLYYGLGFDRFLGLRYVLSGYYRMPMWNGEILWTVDRSVADNYAHQTFNDLANRAFYAFSSSLF
ncbi:tetratricopeptide repeat protein [Helicobacter sp. L8]|uniref:tetratricopeptide repeat protein n=1 Tax=Helicobacter sp. L8 TaxID=2316078 RepID=UPI000EB0ECD0|nr:tetratricopeptide repeat protein [Helicobacter sp. L8]